MIGKTQLSDWINQVVRRYQRPLTRYTVGFLKSLESAQEVVQESFFRLWKNGPIPEENPLRIWLYRTNRNLAIDRLRKEGKMRFFEGNEDEELQCPKTLPSENFEAKESKKVLLKELENLPGKYQEILRLKFQEELSYKEISEVTGQSISHIGVLLHKAILHLRQVAEKGGL